MAKFTNPKNGLTRTEDYRFTVTDLRDFELAQLKEAAKTHNKAVRKAVRDGTAKIREDGDRDYSMPKVSLMRVHIMPRGPRTEASVQDFSRRRAYDSYLPQKHATHFDVYFREDSHNNHVLREEMRTGLTSSQQSKVHEATGDLMRLELNMRAMLRKQGISWTYVDGQEMYVTTEKKIELLRAAGVPEASLERMV